MKTFFFAVVFIFIINSKLCQSINYTNYTLYNVLPVERYQLEFLQNLEKQKYINVIFWTRPQRVYNNIQILVPNQDLVVFKERLNHFHLNGSVLTNNMQKLFDSQKIRRYTQMKYESFSWDAFYDLESVYQWMTDIALKYNDRVQLRPIGKSSEGREILAFEITTENAKGKALVEGALHGNEWIATVFVTYLANQLINAEKSKNWRLKQVAKRYNWYIIPVANPDGYDYSMKVDRLWRKNRKKTINGSIGVDLNGNFDYSFCKHGGSSDINSQYYCGPKAFSEPETLALSEYTEFNRYQLNCYFSFHAYGQNIIIPYSDRVQHIENFLEMPSLKPFEAIKQIRERMILVDKAVIYGLTEDLMKGTSHGDNIIHDSNANGIFMRILNFKSRLQENYGKQAILKMYKLNGVKYGVGTIYDIYGYKSSGDSVSWVKKRYKVKYALAFYLRDNGTYGYALPSDRILPTCKETLIGLLELMTVRHRSVERELFSIAIDLKPRFYVLLFTMTFVFC